MWKLALLTAGIWTAVSFLFARLWGAMISRLSDPAGYDPPAELPGAGNMKKRRARRPRVRGAVSETSRLVRP
jgi:hypothetical protein